MMDERAIREAVRTTWDHASISYDSNPGHGIRTGEEKTAWKQELHRDLPPGPLRVLDAGCGTGAMAFLFAEMGHQVVGIDLSGEMVAQARKKAKTSNYDLDLLTGDAEQLPFGNGSFDVVVTRHLLWTLPHPETALKDWHRVLKPGGRVLIIDGVWDDKSLLSWLKIRVSSGMARIFEPDNTHHRSYGPDIRSRLPYGGGVPEEITLKYLEEAGFVHIQTRDLMYIRGLYRPELPWYKKLNQGRSYYIIASMKKE